MAEEVREVRDKVTIIQPTLYDPAKNPFLKTIEVCVDVVLV